MSITTLRSAERRVRSASITAISRLSVTTRPPADLMLVVRPAALVSRARML
jgi:hypothetical protein